MATCCQSNSNFFIFAVLVVWCSLGRVAVKNCFKLLSFFYIYSLKRQASRNCMTAIRLKRYKLKHQLVVVVVDLYGVSRNAYNALIRGVVQYIIIRCSAVISTHTE